MIKNPSPFNSHVSVRGEDREKSDTIATGTDGGSQTIVPRAPTVKESTPPPSSQKEDTETNITPFSTSAKSIDIESLVSSLLRLYPEQFFDDSGLALGHCISPSCHGGSRDIPRLETLATQDTKRASCGMTDVRKEAGPVGTIRPDRSYLDLQRQLDFGHCKIDPSEAAVPFQSPETRKRASFKVDSQRQSSAGPLKKRPKRPSPGIEVAPLTTEITGQEQQAPTSSMIDSLCTLAGDHHSFLWQETGLEMHPLSPGQHALMELPSRGAREEQRMEHALYPSPSFTGHLGKSKDEPDTMLFEQKKPEQGDVSVHQFAAKEKVKDLRRTELDLFDDIHRGNVNLFLDQYFTIGDGTASANDPVKQEQNTTDQLDVCQPVTVEKSVNMDETKIPDTVTEEPVPLPFTRWSPTEDALLAYAVQQEGGPPISWTLISRKYFQGRRNVNQCKGRWKKVSG